MSLLLDLLPLLQNHGTPTPTGGGVPPFFNPLPQYQDHPIVRLKTRKALNIQYADVGRVYNGLSMLALPLQGSAQPKQILAGRSLSLSRLEISTVRATPILHSRSEVLVSSELSTLAAKAYGTTRADLSIAAQHLRADRSMDSQYLKRSDEEALLVLLAVL